MLNVKPAFGDRNGEDPATGSDDTGFFVVAPSAVFDVIPPDFEALTVAVTNPLAALLFDVPKPPPATAARCCC